jgi:uncharacterized protein YdeI (YjbR/CyaY-like superfamily)
MRCKSGGTSECKVHNWTKEFIALREIVLECGLKEEIKWSVPCYTFKGKNIVLVSAFKETATLSFFKGILINDPHKLLQMPGKNSQSSRFIHFTRVEDIEKQKHILKSYVQEAIKIEQKGLKVAFNKNPELIPIELEKVFAQNPELEKAFYKLTPGRQRGYILYFSAPKQSKTKIARIHKFISKIVEGKGFHDR